MSDLTPEILAELRLKEFVAIDLETTGLNYLTDDIIEFGGIRFIDGKPEQQLSLLIKPTKPIPLPISRITGLTDQDVKDAPSFEKVWEQILDFVGDLPVVAHNTNFDLPFLEYHFRKANNEHADGEKMKPFRYLGNEYFDTVVLARTFLPFLHQFSLGALAEYFEIPQPVKHRALPDAEVAGELFLRLLAIALRTEFRDIQRMLDILEPTDEPLKTLFFNLASLLSSGKYHFPSGIDRELFQVKANFYNIIGEEVAPSIGKLEVEPIDVEEIGEFFSETGELAREFGTFEMRTSQQRMAIEVAKAFNEQKFLVVEAGTGTGKSLAYLLPAIKWSVKNYGPYGRVIISTNTKNLQEQLFFKDIPILHSILKEKFKAVLLKGKANYLCLDKWATILSDMKYRLSSYERIKILPLYLWVKHTETGDIAENGGFAVERNLSLWSKFIAENNYCPGKACKYYDKCYLMRARNNARDAHLVLVNHSLLFSDLASDQAILSKYTNVIFDEAHNVEKVATDYLGMEISLWNFRDTLKKLFWKERLETGVLVQLQKRLFRASIEENQKNLLKGQGEKASKQVQRCWEVTQGFFRILTQELRQLIPEQSNNSQTLKHRYSRADGLLERIQNYYSELISELKKLLTSLHEILEILKELPEEALRYQKQIYQEILAQFTQIDTLINTLQFLVSAEWDNWVYWFELPAKENSDDSRLYGAPLDIAELLNERLYSNLNTAVFTSATLTVGKRFDYFLKRIGLDRVDPERLETVLLASPFQYDEQVLLAIPSFIPDPRSAQFRDALKEILTLLATELNRGTLVLFTSYALLNDLYETLRAVYESHRVPVYAQGINGSRHAIINYFKQQTNSVLFGTDSFWEGVDVPGESLELLLITKLPFDVPTEPLIQAKIEKIKREGGNPFFDYTIPEAVIKFRQGFGRLIRSKTDYGAVIILDNRVIKKMYGRHFLNSLPVQSKIFPSLEELIAALKRWFE